MIRWLFLLFAAPLCALPETMCHPEIMVEGLYLHPTACDLDFVIQDSRPFNPATTPLDLPQGDSHNIRPDFNGGVRLALGYFINCWQLRLVYTYLSTLERRTFIPMEGEGQWPVAVHPRYTDGTPLFPPLAATEIAPLTFAKGTSHYQTFQLEWGRDFAPKCRLYLRSYGALQLAYIGNALEAFYRGTERPGEADASRYQSKSNWNRWCWGAGPLFGTTLRYTLGYNFGVGALLQMGVMAGQTHGDIKQWIEIEATDGTPQVTEHLDVFRRYRLLIFPFFEGKIGINYLWCCGDCFTMLIELGYGFLSYINSVERFTFNDQRGTGMSSCYSFGLDGVYLQFKLQL
ncbi:MAG: Lpg1974 family pore-forming outer membrane protein [Parachlamydiales bacterium]